MAIRHLALIDGVSFEAASSGTGSFVFGTTRASFLSLAQAVAQGTLVDSQIVTYIAQDSVSDPTQREWGRGVFTAATSTITRNSIYSTVNNGVVGSGSPLNFTTAPIVSLTILREDMNYTIHGYNAKFAQNDMTFYCDPAGNDANLGTVGSPFQSPQRAVSEALSFNYQNTYKWTIQLADGNYLGTAGSGSFSYYINGTEGDNANIIGNLAAPQNVIINRPQMFPGYDTNYSKLGGFTIKTGSSIAPTWEWGMGLMWFAYPIIFDRDPAAGTIDQVFYTTGTGHGCTMLIDTTVTLTPTFASKLAQYFALAQPGHIEFVGATVNFSTTPISLLFELFRADNYSTITWSGVTATNAASVVSNASLGLVNNSKLTTDGGLITDLPGNGTATTFDQTCTVEGGTRSGLFAQQIAGAPTTANLAPGTWGVFKDTGGITYIAYNDAGSIKTASLV